jgi:replicative DNA helicase
MLDYSPPPPDEAIELLTVPHSREAEEAATGSVFIDPDCYFEASRLIMPSDFYTHRLRWIWEAFQTLIHDRHQIDLLTVSDELARRGVLAEVGGPAYLTALVNQVPTSLNAVEYAGIVKEYAERRRGIQMANDVAQDAYNLSADFDLGRHALNFAGAAGRNGLRIDTDSAAEEMNALIDNPEFCTTGLVDVDEKIGGLFPYETSVLGGYQGTGKSALKIQSARRNAERGKRVLLIDLEMTAAQTWFRMACGDMGIDMNRVRSGRVDEVTKEELKLKALELGAQYKGRLAIYQAPMTPADILSAAMIERPDIIYVDTLKNIGGKPSRESKQEWYDFVINFLRQNVALNKTIGAHVQILHHINRSTFKENRRPSMHDLMFAGESDTDNVFLLWRKPEDYDVTKGGGVRTMVPITFIADKSRFGWTGDEEVNFKLVNQSFHGMAKY